MRFYTQQHQYYCGIDLHARKMYICILDAAGEVVVHRNGTCSPKHFLRVIAPYRDADAFRRLRSVPGIGKILALVILYEIHDISRFPHVQEFASYSRLVKCQKSSAGKLSGYSGTKIGNAHLKWAFSEAAVLFLRNNPLSQALHSRLAHKPR